jgi:N-acetylglucosaminyl-diphospho-decaprenol L-rhamnosyltransferase
MSRITIAVVAWNSAREIESCLAACGRNHTGPIVVIDNHSTDDTAQRVARFSRVRLVRNPENRGFAGAVNQALRLAETEFVLLLNPDVQLACDAAGAGAAAGVLLGADGQAQRGFTFRRLPTAAALSLEMLGINRLWPTNPVNRRWRCADADLTRSQYVEQPAGAFLLLRKSVWQAVGGFDERFFPAWFEDVDFCRRLHEAGEKVLFEPRWRARHEGGRSVQQLDSKAKAAAWYGNLLRYAGVWKFPARCLTSVAALLALGPRLLQGFLSSGGGLQAGGIFAVAIRALRLLMPGNLEMQPDGEEVRKSKKHLHAS